MRPRYMVPALTLACIATALLLWRHKIQTARAAEVPPYTAHLTITKNRLLPDGSPSNGVATVLLARDRQGRTYEKTELGASLVEDPGKSQTLTWDSHSQVAHLAQWPYWSGRKGCWADEHGQIQSRVGDWYPIPHSPGEAKLETIPSVAVGESPSGQERVQARVASENLGEKEIHGLPAYGMRWSMTPIEAIAPTDLPAYTTELWKSKELDLKLLEVTSGPRYGSVRKELTDLNRSDPDPALFEPPPGYKIEKVAYHQVPCNNQ